MSEKEGVRVREPDEWDQQTLAPGLMRRYQDGDRSSIFEVLGEQKKSSEILASSSWRADNLRASLVLDHLEFAHVDLLCESCRSPEIHTQAVNYAVSALRDRFVTSGGTMLNESAIVLCFCKRHRKYVIIDGYHRLLAAKKYWPEVVLSAHIIDLEEFDREKHFEDVLWDSLIRNLHSKVFPELRTPLYMELLRRIYIFNLVVRKQVPSEAELSDLTSRAVSM